MKSILYKLLIVLVALFISACGGGNTKESNGNSQTKISIISCDGTGSGVNDCVSGSENYTCIQKGDTLVSTNNDTSLSLVTNSDGSKKVCVDNPNIGQAFLLR